MEASASSRGPATFLTQANALFRKNLSFQKKNLKTNIWIVAFPVLLCVLLVVLCRVINHELSKPQFRCGCQCVNTTRTGNGSCETMCGAQYSTTVDQAMTCAIPHPIRWPAFMTAPLPEHRAVRRYGQPGDLPDPNWQWWPNCPVTVLVTGQDRSLVDDVQWRFFPYIPEALSIPEYLNSSNYAEIEEIVAQLSDVVLASDAPPGYTQFFEPAVTSGEDIYLIQPECFSGCNETHINNETRINLCCIQGVSLWRKSAAAINDELYTGHKQVNPDHWSYEYLAAYDFLNTSDDGFNIDIWYKPTTDEVDILYQAIALSRVPRSLNVASNAFLQYLIEDDMQMQLEYVKEMPKGETRIMVDFSSLAGPLFYTWIVELLFPVMLANLIYEKKKKLKIMMKMHGLKDGPYWLISYAYFFSLSVAYMMFFAIFGALIGLNIFLLNDYGIQFVFYFIYINLQIVVAILVSSLFSSDKMAQVFGYFYLFGTGLLGTSLLLCYIEDASPPRNLLRVMEIIPGFSLYRGLYELEHYAYVGAQTGMPGMRWANLHDPFNGMKDVLVIMVVEWFLLLPVAFYLGSRIKMCCLSYSGRFQNEEISPGPGMVVEMEKPDVLQERKIVEKLLRESYMNHVIVCDNLQKIYPGKDGNPKKLAVRGLSLALPRGQCFGMLGPNGAGKSSFINMMVGITAPSSGTAYVNGMDRMTHMDEIYTSMGVCPQDDLLWESLTGREHLLFYGRLKNLKGADLTQAVDESLKSVNLFYGGFGGRQVRKYSGGMKRRLSVAISLIGDPKIVYMDEPSTGLDPISKHNLWKVLKEAKRNRAVILTTHSMEEAEVLCDRIGIFVDGSFQCLGSPNELKARYGGTYMFTVTTASLEEEEKVQLLARRLSPEVKKIYHLSGTQKFELPKRDVGIADAFRAVEDARSELKISAWGLVDVTLEDVFIKVAKEAPQEALDIMLP